MEMGMIASTSMLLPMVWVLLIPFLVMYILGDLNGRRSGHRDPKLGARVLLTLLMGVASHLVLAGMALVMVSFFEEMPEAIRKTGTGFAVGGLVAGALPLWFYLTRVRAPGPTAIERQALGVNALVTGLLFGAAAVVTSTMYFNGERISAPAAVTVIYLLASILFMGPLTRAPATAPG